jgi:Xaa-Pro aminopeptidase
MRVAPKAAMSGQLKPGVFFSDEPGYYKASYSDF